MENKEHQRPTIVATTDYTDHHRRFGCSVGGGGGLPAPEKWLELCITKGICGSGGIY